MKSEKLFYLTLNYVCDSYPDYNYNHPVGCGFKSFDKACQFADTVMEQTKTFLTYVNNYSVTYR